MIPREDGAGEAACAWWLCRGQPIFRCSAGHSSPLRNGIAMDGRVDGEIGCRVAGCSAVARDVVLLGWRRE